MGTVRGRKRVGEIRVRSVRGLPVIDQTFEYHVDADSSSESQVSILESNGLPRVGLSVTLEGGAVCKAISAKLREGTNTVWDVRAEFSSEVEESQQNPDPNTNPEAWIPIRETKFERLQEIVTEDLDGEPIANSAGQPFPNGMTRTRKIPVWEFFQFEPASVTDEDVISRSDVINEAEKFGKPAKTWLCTVLSSVVGFYYGQPRRLTRYELKYNSKTWEHKRLDVGTVFLSGGNLEPYLDNEGNVINGPLNGSGGKQASGTAPAILAFKQHELSDFAFLRIG